jgi:hypothetical protein
MGRAIVFNDFNYTETSPTRSTDVLVSQRNGSVARITSIEDPEHSVDLAFEFWRHFSAMSAGIQK